MPDVSSSERIEIIYGMENTTKALLQFLGNASGRVDIMVDKHWASVVLANEPYKEAIMSYGRKGVRARIISEITKDNLHHSKEIMNLAKLAEIRHLDGVKGNFGVSETEYLATAILEQAQPFLQAIYSNSRQIVEQHQYLFETLWEKAIPSKQRIKEIEDGIEPTKIELLADSKEIEYRAWKMIESAKEEISIFFATETFFNLAMRESMSGNYQQEIIKKISNYSTREKKNMRIRLLVPSHNDRDVAEETKQTIQQLRAQMTEVDIGLIDKSLQTNMLILLVDRRELLLSDLGYDTRDNFSEARGISLYSKSKSIVSSYVAIFEFMWKQKELYDLLKAHDSIMQEFAQIAAHELRAPLTPIILTAETLRLRNKKYFKKKADSFFEAKKDDIDIIYRNAKRMEQLASDILDIARMESGLFQLNIQPFDFKKVLESAIKDYSNILEKQHKDNKVSIKLSYDLPSDDASFLQADKGRIYQVISNLLSNAVKATEKGSITVSVKQEGQEKEEKRKKIQVSIQDTGTGIPPEIFPKLFSKFGTLTHSESGQIGSGLGLFICKKIIEAHGGEIWIENNYDNNTKNDKEKGATVTFTLPVTAEMENYKKNDTTITATTTRVATLKDDKSDVTKREGGEEEEESRKRRKRIMIVDDDHDFATSIKKVLEENGFEVDAFNDPIIALSKFVARTYDFIILDIKMPGMSGLELYKALREKDKNIKVAFLTGFEVHHQEFKKVFPDIEVACFIKKPIGMEKLIKSIRTSINNRNAEGISQA